MSRNERLLQKMVKKAPGDKDDVIQSRRVVSYMPPPALSKARARAGFRKKEPAHIEFSAVTEVAWSQQDSHHIEGSSFVKHFE